MDIRSLTAGTTLALALLAPFPAAASSIAVVRSHDALPAEATPQLANMSAEQLLAFHERLALELETDRYAHLRARDRRAIERAQDQIHRQLAGGRGLEQLDARARLTLFNAHERVVAIVNQAEDERVVCERRHRVGSHRPIVECATVAERERLRHETRRTLQLESTDTSTY